jgi:hypothetical protein
VKNRGAIRRERPVAGGVPSAPEIRTIRTLAWARVAFLSAGAAACLAGCVTGAPIPPTYTQDELKATCERNGFRWYRDDLEGGFCARK